MLRIKSEDRFEINEVVKHKALKLKSKEMQFNLVFLQLYFLDQFNTYFVYKFSNFIICRSKNKDSLIDSYDQGFLTHRDKEKGDLDQHNNKHNKKHKSTK